MVSNIFKYLNPVNCIMDSIFNVDKVFTKKHRDSLSSALINYFIVAHAMLPSKCENHKKNQLFSILFSIKSQFSQKSTDFF